MMTDKNHTIDMSTCQRLTDMYCTYVEKISPMFTVTYPYSSIDPALRPLDQLRGEELYSILGQLMREACTT